jgi:hypothetical protein
MELRLARSYATGIYQVVLRTWLGDEAWQELAAPPPELSEANPESVDPRVYGEMLHTWLFQGRIREAFERARWSTPSRSSFAAISAEGGIRFLVALAEDLPPEIIRVRWEALHVPDGYLPLSMSTAFSRLIRVRAHPSPPLSPTPLRMLQIIANPTGLGAYGLQELDSPVWNFMDSVTKRPWGQSMELSRLGPAPTLDQVRATLQKSYHVVYVAAHVLFDEKGTGLILANNTGQAMLVPVEAMIDHFVPTDQPAPSLVFLATPAPSSTSGGQPWFGLVSRLLRAGVRFVITLHGPLEPWRLAQFNESFFNSLLQTDLIDVAMATARFGMLEPDRLSSWEWTYPVLTLRTHGASLVAAT